MKIIEEWDYKRDSMVIHTGHKGFDRQTNLISDGNLYANTMLGRYIRAWNNTRHWKEGRQHEPGYLFGFDMEVFDVYLHHYPTIRSRIKDLAMDRQVCVYQFFHHNRKGKRVVHGFVVTDGKTNDHLETFVIGPTHKSYGVVYTAREYIANFPKEV